MKDLKIVNPGDLVLYKNNQLIAFNKPSGIGVQPDQSGDKSLVDLAEIYCKAPLHVIHRLDRPASGVVLFAKNKKALAKLNEQFKTRQIEKTYLAVVKRKPDQESGKLSHFLTKKKSKAIVSEKESASTKEAQLSYNLLGAIENYFLLEIQLHTGRFHQVRAQLAAINSPIKGDVKYGFRRGNKDRSIHLHAWKLKLTHPVSGETQEIIAPVPEQDPVWNAFKATLNG